MPASDLKNPDDRPATGGLVRDLYCPDCSWYSGGGRCRVCQRETGEVQQPETRLDLTEAPVVGAVQMPIFSLGPPKSSTNRNAAVPQASSKRG